MFLNKVCFFGLGQSENVVPLRVAGVFQLLLTPPVNGHGAATISGT